MIRANPTVSVIVTAYREDDYLREAIASVLAQSYRDFEVLVRDNANQASTATVVAGFRDSRLRYTGNPIDLGAAMNHWCGFREAQGQYVAILNHDDRWKGDFLEHLVPPFDHHPRLALAFSDHHLMDAEGRQLSEATESNTRIYKRDQLRPGLHEQFDSLLVEQTVPMVMAAVFRKNCLDEKDVDFFVESGPAYDLALTYLLWRSGGSCYFDPTRLTEYRIHGRSATTQAAISWALGSARCYDRIAGDSRSSDIRRMARRKAAESYATAALRTIRLGQKAAARHAWASLRTRPGYRGLATLLLSLLPQRGARFFLSRV